MFTVNVEITHLERMSEWRYMFTAVVTYSNSIVHTYRFERCSIVRQRDGLTVVFAPSVYRDGAWHETVAFPFDVRNAVHKAAEKAIAAEGGW